MRIFRYGRVLVKDKTQIIENFASNGRNKITIFSLFMILNDSKPRQWLNTIMKRIIGKRIVLLHYSLLTNYNIPNMKLLQFAG